MRTFPSPAPTRLARSQTSTIAFRSAATTTSKAARPSIAAWPQSGTDFGIPTISPSLANPHTRASGCSRSSASAASATVCSCWPTVLDMDRFPRWRLTRRRRSLDRPARECSLRRARPVDVCWSAANVADEQGFVLSGSEQCSSRVELWSDRRARVLGCVAQHLPGDDELLNLAGSLVDTEEARVAIEALDGDAPHVARATVYLYGAIGDAPDRLAREVLAGGGCHASVRAAVVGAGTLQHERTRGEVFGL